MECILENTTVHYEMLGDRGMPLVVLHGGQGDYRAAAAAIEPLFSHREGWRRIYPDLPGHGATPGPAWMQSEDQVLELLLSFLDSVIPGERFALAGFSRGGYFARGMLHHRPGQVAGLLLVAPIIRREDKDLPGRSVLARDEAALAELDEWTRNIAERLLVAQDQATLSRLRPQMSLIQGAKQDNAFQGRLKRNFSFPVDELARPFEKPALFLLGRQDHVEGYRNAWRVLENFPRATYAVLDRAGHLLVGVEQAQVCQALMNDWLDRVQESALVGSD